LLTYIFIEFHQIPQRERAELIARKQNHPSITPQKISAFIDKCIANEKVPAQMEQVEAINEIGRKYLNKKFKGLDNKRISTCHGSTLAVPGTYIGKNLIYL